MNSSSPESGETVAVRPEGKRKMSLPSEVIPTTLARTEPRRPCGKSSDIPELPRERRELEVTVFFLFREVDPLDPFERVSALA